MPTIEYTAECASCQGTGIYIGMAERDGAGIVCHSCKGAGRKDHVITYNDFEGRKVRDNVRHVYQTNPGIVIGEGNEFHLTDFGGIPYAEWLNGATFGPGTENRRYTCPAWFYQSADYDKKPDWDECWSNLGGTFSSCKHFCNKSACWARWDKEFT